MHPKKYAELREKENGLAEQLSDYYSGVDCVPSVLPRTEDDSVNLFHVVNKLENVGIFSIGAHPENADLAETLFEKRKRFYQEVHGAEYFIKDGQEYVSDDSGVHLVYSIQRNSPVQGTINSDLSLPFNYNPRRCNHRRSVREGMVSCHYKSNCPLQVRSPVLGSGPDFFCQAG